MNNKLDLRKEDFAVFARKIGMLEYKEIINSSIKIAIAETKEVGLSGLISDIEIKVYDIYQECLLTGLTPGEAKEAVDDVFNFYLHLYNTSTSLGRNYAYSFSYRDYLQITKYQSTSSIRTRDSSLKDI